MNILAIDPGGDGSAAELKMNSYSIELVWLLSFKFDPGWEFALHERVKETQPHVLMEDVHARRGRGAVSEWNFSDANATARTAVKLAGRGIKYVGIKEWPMRLGLPKRHDIIDAAKRRAARRKDQEWFSRRLFPEQLGRWVEKDQGDVFASPLIAYAGCLDVLNLPMGTLPPTAVDLLRTLSAIPR